MKSLTHNRKSIWFAALVFLASRAPQVFANPTGLTVAGGSASAQSSGSQLNVTAGNGAVLNWSSFNIASGETTTFIQPSSDSVVLNVIGGASPSQIYGSLNANGTVILENANGFYFGPNSMIKVGGSFIATTAPALPDFGSSSAWQFNGMPPLASIVNYGQIEVGQGRSLFLIAENIENHGSLAAPGGNVDLAAGQNVLISETPDGRGLSATVTLPSGSVDNFGRITADAGTIALQAKVVNQDGVLQANSIQNQNGVIELIASDTVNLGANSQIIAQGDNSASGSAGGNVTIKADNTFSDTTGSAISTAGGSNGGNGGNLEISAPNVASLNSTMDATAATGWTGGTFFLDPVNIILGTSTAGGAINVKTAFAGFSSIQLQASGNITFNTGTAWDLSGSTGQTTGQLTLQAGGDITFGNNAKITDANNWSVTLEAGYNFGSHTINSGVGNIYLNGGSGKTQNGTILLGSGNVTLEAGQSILVGTGSVFTTGGGSIFAYALAGDINCGTSNGGTSSTSQTSDYGFSDTGATPNPFLGGISTAAGGNVTLIAGNNIDSTPKIPSKQAPGASGTYGFGNVTVIAGNQITGNYTLADGVGTMIAGVPVSSAQAAILQNPTANPSTYAGTLNDLVTAVQLSHNVNGNIGAAPVAGNPSISPVTFSLISGSWNVWAANDISIKEVNNPNGAFNVAQSFLFNYAPNASANFWAGNAIELTGANLGRLSSVNRIPIYAPILSLNAGVGGIKIDKSVILAPSSQGSLTIITRDGGNLSGAVTTGSTVLNGIVMSDSSSTDYTTYAAEHDNIHVNDANLQPVLVDVSGSINSFSLTVPTFADITVHGDTYNFGFKGRNLSSDQTTSINVLGAITYRGNLTSQTLSDPISKSLYNSVAAGDPADSAYLRYDATTGTLTYIGVMSASTEAALLNPVDANGNPIAFTPSQLIAWQASITALYVASQTASLGDQGLALAGPGNFDVTATSIDLGVSGGIRVIAPDAGLAAISPYGADLSVTTAGDLSMTSTKISNESYLGGIMLNIGGTLDVGGQFTTLGNPNAAKGIFTTSGGNVSVIANGDVNVNSSRIAAYNGGNIFVKSITGDINAGTGGAGFVTMTALQLNKKTGQLVSIPASIPGSGILATTINGSSAQLGNITLESPQGSVNASLGGVLQIAFNGADTRNNFIDINAGKDINATGSGVIGSNIKLKAGGNINGVIIGSQGINVNAGQNVDVTAVSGGNVDIASGGTVSGTIVGGGNVSVSGDSITAAVLGGSVSASGDTSGASLGIPQSNVAKEVAETTDSATATQTASTTDDEDQNKKKGISLAQKVSRVTVVLPGAKKISERATGNNPL